MSGGAGGGSARQRPARWSAAIFGGRSVEIHPAAFGPVAQRLLNGGLRQVKVFGQLPWLGAAGGHGPAQRVHPQIAGDGPAVRLVLVPGDQIVRAGCRMRAAGGAMAQFMRQLPAHLAPAARMADIQKNAVAAVHLDGGGVGEPDVVGINVRAHLAGVVIYLAKLHRSVPFQLLAAKKARHLQQFLFVFRGQSLRFVVQRIGEVVHADLAGGFGSAQQAVDADAKIGGNARQRLRRKRLLAAALQVGQRAAAHPAGAAKFGDGDVMGGAQRLDALIQFHNTIHPFFVNAAKNYEIAKIHLKIAR